MQNNNDEGIKKISFDKPDLEYLECKIQKYNKKIMNHRKYRNGTGLCYYAIWAQNRNKAILNIPAIFWIIFFL